MRDFAFSKRILAPREQLSQMTVRTPYASEVLVTIFAQDDLRHTMFSNEDLNKQLLCTEEKTLTRT
jgi:hypothetical protein